MADQQHHCSDVANVINAATLRHDINDKPFYLKVASPATLEITNKANDAPSLVDNSTDVDLNILSWNVAGLQSKLGDEDWLRIIKEQDVVMFQETWATDDLYIEGFHCISTVASHNNRGAHQGDFLLGLM